MRGNFRFSSSSIEAEKLTDNNDAIYKCCVENSFEM